MARSADELPREGLDTQQFIENISERVGANNTIDVIMRNLPRIARQVGARPPAYHPSHAELNMVKPRMVESPNVVPQPPQDTQPSNIPPKIEDMPDTPRGLHTPKARMMPGADTEPGKPISEKDAVAFNKAVTEMNVRQGVPVQQIARNSWDDIPSQFGNRRANFSSSQNVILQKPVFFKDGLGNEYKTVGDKLYVLGWQDSNVKIRLISEATGKEVPTNGKKFQIYGWHLVQKMDEKESTDADDITQIENEIKTDESVKKAILPKKENHDTLAVPRVPMIAKGSPSVAESKTEEMTVEQDSVFTETVKPDVKDALSEKVQILMDSKNHQISENVISAEGKTVDSTSDIADNEDKKKKLSKRRLI